MKRLKNIFQHADLTRTCPRTPPKNLIKYFYLDIRNLDLESLSLEDSGNPKNRMGIKCLTRSHRKLCRTKAIHSRPGLHLSNSAEMIKRPKSGRSKSDFMARRNLEDLELLDKMSTVMSRHCSTRSSTIEPVLESCLE